MMQVGRYLLDVVGGALMGKKYLIVDRDMKYCGEFRSDARAGGHSSDSAAPAFAQADCVPGTLDPKRP
jgi:hypothetical protein